MNTIQWVIIVVTVVLLAPYLFWPAFRRQYHKEYDVFGRKKSPKLLTLSEELSFLKQTSPSEYHTKIESLSKEQKDRLKLDGVSLPYHIGSDGVTTFHTLDQSFSPRMRQDEYLREMKRSAEPPLTPVKPWVPPTEEEKARFRKENGYIYRPQHDPDTGVEALPDREKSTIHGYGSVSQKRINHRDPNGFGLRKTAGGRYRKTRNTYISDDLEYVLLEPQERVAFSYTSMKGNQRDHQIQVKYVTGSIDLQACHMVGMTDDGMKLSFFLDKMQNVHSHLTGERHADGLAWLKAITRA